MSHMINLEMGDKCYATEKTWHGLETILEDGITLESISSLNGKMERFPAFVEIGGEKTPLLIKGKPHTVIGERWQDEDGEEKITLFQTAADSYQPIDFERLWNLLEKGFAGIPYTITCVGSHSQRAKVWISAQLIQADQFIAGGDQFKANVNLLDSRDGSTPFILQDSNTRVVCNNTFSMDVSYASEMSNGFRKTGLQTKDSGGFVGIVKHTKNSAMEIDYIQKTLPQLLANREAFIKQYETLKNESVSIERVRKILLGYYAKKTSLDVSKGGILSTRSINQLDAVNKLFTKGKGNHGKTLADLFNAFTEYYTTGDGSGSANVSMEKKFASSEFGTAAEIKRDSFKMLSSEDEQDELIKIGEKMILNADKMHTDLMAMS